MIIIEQPSGKLLTVAQADHADTCAAIGQAWRRPETIAPDIWHRLVQATARHDDGWIKAERTPTFDDAGRPHDFKTIPTDQHVAIWQRTIDLARDADPYQGLIIALHARRLYTTLPSNHGDGPAATRFIDRATLSIDGMIKRLRDSSDPALTGAVTPKNLKAAQRLLSFFDAFSLMLLGAIAWQSTTDVLCHAVQCDQLSVATPDPTTHAVQIDPWPFIGDRVRIETDARILDNQRFDGFDDFQAQYQAASLVRLSWTTLQCLTN